MISTLAHYRPCFYLLGLALLIVSCKKDAGEGGTSTITGKVVVYTFDGGTGAMQDTLPGSTEDVYIIYGADHTSYDNDYKASYDGTFEFKYLQKGKYRLFAYSRDSSGVSNGTFNALRPKLPVFVDVEITSNRSTVTAPNLVILKNN